MVEDIVIPEGSLSLIHLDGDDYFDQLLSETPWQQRSSLILGKRVRQPRLTAWYGDEGCQYQYSGVTNTPLPWRGCMSLIRDEVEGLLDCRFNSALLNLYRTGRDSIGFHSDDEPELGPTPIIASVSYGAVRTIEFRHRRGNHVPVLVELPSKSLLVMMGDTQKNWKHGIDKVKDADPRINITFRQILI